MGQRAFMKWYDYIFGAAILTVTLILSAALAHCAERTVNWKLLTAAGIELGADTFDQYVTLQGTRLYQQSGGSRGCQEANIAPPFPSAKRLYIQNYAIDAGLIGFAYFMRRKHVPFVPYAPLLTAAVGHINGGRKWFTWGCL